MPHNREGTPEPRRSILKGARNATSTPDGTCEEWVEFVKQYQVHARRYADAVAELSSAPGAEFNRAWMRSESLGQKLIGLHAALLEHEHKHDCSRSIEAEAVKIQFQKHKNRSQRCRNRLRPLDGDFFLASFDQTAPKNFGDFFQLGGC